MRTNSLLPSLQMYKLQEEAAKNQNLKENTFNAYGRDSPSVVPCGGGTKMPSWLGKASEELAR